MLCNKHMKLDLSKSPILVCDQLEIYFDTGFDFIDALAITEYDLIAVFVDGWSGSHDYVGKLFDYSGKEVTAIPFPPNGRGGRQVQYWYASVVTEGLWIGFHQKNERDFGGVFNLTEWSYSSFNEAR